MKKSLFALLLAALTCGPVAAQDDSPAADSTQVDEIEAFSDTTSVADTSVVVPSAGPFDSPEVDGEDTFSYSHSLESILDKQGEGLMGMLFVLAVLTILFVLAPIAILGIILWFIYKNRKNRIRLAEMAMKNGQPVPDELVSDRSVTSDDFKQKAIRQIALGIGLIFLLGWAAGKIGAGIGILVLCIGLGNLYIARTTRNKEQQTPQTWNDTSVKEM